MKRTPIAAEQARALLLVALFCATLFWRSPDLWVSPRFWAEEGKHYYAALQGESVFSMLTLVVRGNYLLLTNGVTYLATLTPATLAAHVTTYLSLLCLIFCIWLLSILSIQQGWSLFTSALTAIVLALLPQGYEIYLTATNIQWVCSVGMLLLSVVQTSDWRPHRQWIGYAFTLLAGLTGVCSVMLAPFFLIRKRIEPSAFHFNAGMILAVCTMLHAGVIFSNEHVDRNIPSNLFLLSFPTVLQSVFSPLVGATAVDRWVATAQASAHGWATILAIYLGSIPLLWAACLGAEKKGSRGNLTYTLTGAWILVCTLNTLGSLGDPKGLLSGWSGGRYYYLGAVCFLLLLASTASSERPLRSKIAIACICMMVATGVAQKKHGIWKNWLIKGESWRAQVLRCPDTRPCDVQAWPGGPDWTFQLKSR